ncbi:MAG: ANTAR domain-containing protein [Actinomycetes bacterium]
MTMDAAFDRLRGYARNHNVRLSEVARKVVETDFATDVLGTPTVHSRAAGQQ